MAHYVRITRVFLLKMEASNDAFHMEILSVYLALASGMLLFETQIIELKPNCENNELPYIALCLRVGTEYIQLFRDTRYSSKK